MKLLNKRLLAIAAMTVISGAALAKTADQNSNSGMLSSEIPDSHIVFSESSLHAFTDILDLGIGMDNRTMVANTASRAQAESSAQSAGIYDLLLALSEEPDANGAVLRADSSPNGTVIDFPALVVPGAHVARVPETTDRKMGDGFLFSVAAIPQPGDWMTLLCGFMVAAFIARRKSSAFAD
jgi:hypothetical protein